MNKSKYVMIGVGMLALETLAAIYGDLPDAQHAWAVHDWNRPKPKKVEPAPYVSIGAPSDAIVLFDGSQESFNNNWCDKDGKPSLWKVDGEGAFYCLPGWKNGGNVYTKRKFGDCQLHIEYQHDADITDGGKGPQMRGNSGVFLMGTDSGYEIQVLESYYTSANLEGKSGFVDNYTDGQAGAVYAENPPLVNPARRPGDWQVYDIVFHQPVWEGEKLVHPGSVTVFFNGVLVQDHWEMEGLTTHAKRRPLKPHATAERLGLQDHGCTVRFRNIWYRPLASRWANTTHSTMSAKTEDVMKLRRATAAKLYAKIADKEAVTAENVLALGEVIGYAREGEYEQQWIKIATAYAGKVAADTKENIAKVRKAMDALAKAGVVTDRCPLYRKLKEIK